MIREPLLLLFWTFKQFALSFGKAFSDLADTDSSEWHSNLEGILVSDLGEFAPRLAERAEILTQRISFSSVALA